MQTLVKMVLALVFSISVNAQTTTPEPPKPPQTYSSSHSSSISVSKTDDDYRIKARFHKSRFEIVKSYLIDNLGKQDLTIKGNSYLWSNGANDFECKLTRTSLRLHMDYELTNETFAELVEDIGKDLKYLISGGSPEDDIKRAEAEIAKAKQELEEAKKRLEQKRN
ncbi:hypothetical protein [Winogradskyella sp. 3972H.M.0a.05]|uniref:hypothetical protein n=1 Tax=Winogradskyella sp. 3972H.M.0a.05 TaxID=2950277 RepID=UPI0033938154